MYGLRSVGASVSVHRCPELRGSCFSEVPYYGAINRACPLCGDCQLFEGAANRGLILLLWEKSFIFSSGFLSMSV